MQITLQEGAIDAEPSCIEESAGEHDVRSIGRETAAAHRGQFVDLSAGSNDDRWLEKDPAQSMGKPRHIGGIATPTSQPLLKPPVQLLPDPIAAPQTPRQFRNIAVMPEPLDGEPGLPQRLPQEWAIIGTQMHELVGAPEMRRVWQQILPVWDADVKTSVRPKRAVHRIKE
jgi:hypothetical protein